MELDEALRQISLIRHQMAHSAVFRGYRSRTIAGSGIAGILTALFQAIWMPSPAADLRLYLMLWCAVALGCVLFAGWELWHRGTGDAGRIEGPVIRSAVEQFLPPLLVGALVTACIYRAAPGAAWLLPGLWSVFFGLGIFASCRILPRQINWAALYYVGCGCCWLRWGGGENAFSPWQMAISFGGGQLLCAAVLYFTLERQHAS